MNPPPHLWTPCAEDTISALELTLPPELAISVASLSAQGVEAVAAGDFTRQLAIAEETQRQIQDWPDLVGQALYLKGEALRILADFEEVGQAQKLRNEASIAYTAAFEITQDPRALRGLARTNESLGDLKVALDQFVQALSMTGVNTRSPDCQNYLSYSHEQIRSLRHKLHCLAAIQSASPKHTAFARQREAEMRRILAESNVRHREVLSLFQANELWWRIEWFMAEVIHAKALVALEEHAQAARRLEWALSQRLAMFTDAPTLTTVELGNLQWWSSVAVRVRRVYNVEQEMWLDRMIELVRTGGARFAIKAAAGNFLKVSAEPWGK